MKTKCFKSSSQKLWVHVISDIIWKQQYLSGTQNGRITLQSLSESEVWNTKDLMIDMICSIVVSQIESFQSM